MDYHRGEQASSVGIEQPVERTPQRVVAPVGHLLRRQAWGGRREGVDGLVLVVDRIALDDDEPQKYAPAFAVWQAAATIGRGHELIEQRLEAELLQEAVDDRQGSQPLTV